MPLTINVGLSRKSSENYQSKGTSINVTAELDHSLLAKPQQLHQEIQALYRQAQEALDQQTSPTPRPASPRSTPAESPPARTASNSPRRTSTSPATQNGTSPGSNPSQPSGHVRSITPSQKRALHAIADKLSVDLEQHAQNLFGCSVSQLSIREASTLIDRLKSSQQSQHPAAQAREERRR